MSGGEPGAGVRVEEIPVIVAARNEERSIERCLRSLLEAAAVASSSLPVRLSLVVGADRCTDRTAQIAGALGVPVVVTSGGKVAAQRACLRPAPFLIFSDADVAVAPETLLGLCRVMLQEPLVQVAFPQKIPLSPRRSSWLAQAAHSYTRGEGFQRQRTWFDGKCFAIRRFEVPTHEQLAPRLAPLEQDRFYAFHEGLTIDDIFLSRWIVHQHGVEALRQSEEGLLVFRAPETSAGMYSYYRRIRRELERVDRIFPEMIPTGRRFGFRRTDWARFLSAPLREQALFALFQAVDTGFGVVYAAERLYFQRLASHDCDAWPVIPETKGIGDFSVRVGGTSEGYPPSRTGARGAGGGGLSAPPSRPPCIPPPRPPAEAGDGEGAIRSADEEDAPFPRLRHGTRGALRSGGWRFARDVAVHRHLAPRDSP